MRLYLCAALGCVAIASLLSIIVPDTAQADAGQIIQPIDDQVRVTLVGNTRPEAHDPKDDLGPVPDSLTLDHIQLQLNRSPQSEQSFETFINQLHDPRSPNYHHWLAAPDIGREFGPAGGDVQKITGWLKMHGFTVNATSSSGMVIDFSGKAGQIRDTFQAPLHYLSVRGQSHVANVRDPQIPAAFSSIVAGIVSLNDFRPHQMYRAHPQYSFASDGSLYQAVVPADLAKIYNLSPLFEAGIAGKAETIAVIEDSDVYSVGDWQRFRATFGLSAHTSGALVRIHPNNPTSRNNCVDPGVNSHDGEAELDAEWASAAAPDATIAVESCADTRTTFGGLIALENLVNSPNPPPIVSISYGECEADNGAAANEAYYSVYQQAAAEGISVFVAAGDEGAASCDLGQWVSYHGIAVSGLASTPYDVAVGGTDFGDTYARSNSLYWSGTNTNAYGSALSYIPEIPWNDSCASTLAALYETGSPVTYGSSGFCASNQGSSFWRIAAGSGGPSGCALVAAVFASGATTSGACSGYPKPAWQRAVLGIPADGLRDIPDVSLFAGDGIWGHYYVFCWTDAQAGGQPCSGNPATWSGAGGTSFSAPIMAGVQALIDQKSASRWGNPDTVYYRLAAKEYGASGNAACNSSLGKAVAASCIFYDVTLGDMDVNCSSAQNLGLAEADAQPVNCILDGKPMGVLSVSNAAFRNAYAATLGWDFASGLGTVNAFNLVQDWPRGQSGSSRN
jgi:subtilase family serine protease